LDSQNLAYAATQIVHNFGAVAVVGGAACALAWHDAEAQRRLAWLVLVGWLAQAASGATFGAISFYYYAKFPDIHGIAIAALIVKVVCAAFGFTLAARQLFGHHSESSRRYAWIALCGLSALALSSAAVLRWFS
jgi:peptidoglycan biosynthesis protein MviN/MurJ (putative lipid II flippase)